MNKRYGAPQAAPATGEPPVPFPWLFWADRPLATQYELMFVPASSPSRLVVEHTKASTSNVYATTGANEFRAPFEHLLNFFQTAAGATAAAHFYRLFDYTHVPSRFVGTNTILNPSVFAGAAAARSRARFSSRLDKSP